MIVLAAELQPLQTPRTCIAKHCGKKATTVLFRQARRSAGEELMIDASSRRFVCDDHKPQGLQPIEEMEAKSV